MHVHTVLSPCGDVEMSPVAIVETAARRGIDILGITDHNSTKHGLLISKLAREKGIFVLCGAEVTTREEAHCLAFFENLETLASFQKYLDSHLPNIKNDPRYFGYQVVLDEQEMIVEEEERLLISGLEQSLDQVEKEVHRLGGLFIPAHIDRPRFSLTSQLGFVPPGLRADALEISRHTSPEEMVRQFPWIASYAFIRSSDAHHPDQLGSGITIFEMEYRSFGEIRKALHKEDHRSTRIEEPII